jgi:hypothetical protein
VNFMSNGVKWILWIYLYIWGHGVDFRSRSVEAGQVCAPYAPRRWTAITMGSLRHRPARAALSIILFLPDVNYTVFLYRRMKAHAFLSHAPSYMAFIFCRSLFDQTRLSVHALDLSRTFIAVC